MKLSVILPIYNAEKYLSEAIQSIINQSYSDYELLAIDDGSTDNSLEILKSFNDPRIVIVQNEKNLGLIHTLNRGLDLAKGEFIARMDADDISLPTRFEKQVNLLNNNPEIGVCSTWIEFFGDGKEIIRFPAEHEEIFFRFLLGVQVGHANSMIRKTILEKNNVRYDENYQHSEDTNLWVNLLPYTRFANIPEILYRYRKYNGQVTQVHQKAVNDSFQRSINIHFSNLLKLFSVSEDKALNLFPSTDVNTDFLDKLEIVLKEIIFQNKQLGLFDREVVRAVLLQLWKDKLRKCNLSIVNNFKRVFLSYFPTYIGFPVLKRIKFSISLL